MDLHDANIHSQREEGLCKCCKKKLQDQNLVVQQKAKEFLKVLGLLSREW